MDSKTFNVSLPIELVKIVDTHAKLQFSTRSEYIKNAIIAQLKTNGHDPTDPPVSAELYNRARKERLGKYLSQINLKELEDDRYK